MKKNFKRGFISSLLILFLALILLLAMPKYATAATAGQVLSSKIYYHLDMGVQLVYYSGFDWEGGYQYGVSTRNHINTRIDMNQEILVKEVYPLESSKGKMRYNFNGETSSNNMPKEFGTGQAAYDHYYKDFVSEEITVNSYSSSEKGVTFNYNALLSSLKPLDVIENGGLGRGDFIYSLFGGEGKLREEQPEIYGSISQALAQGENGTAGSSRLYLVFCPNVIEYQKYLAWGTLLADLTLPEFVKQGEHYTVGDASLIDDDIIVEKAVLERSRESGSAPFGGSKTEGFDWQVMATWAGDLPGENTGGVLQEEALEMGTIRYRLTVTGDNGQVDQVIKTIQVTDGREMEGVAQLNLQPVTYEGHPAWAVDESVFIVDGQSYSSTRAYAEGVGENTFVAQRNSGGQVARKTSTQATVAFPAKGIYQVTLEVKLANKITLEDSKSIEVKKTPTLVDSLGGVQKQNRKQILTAAVATYPGKPITDYFIEICDRKTGEKITLTKQDPQKNNDTIKTRKTETLGGMEQGSPADNNPYWTTFTVEFLTKTPVATGEADNQGQEFSYRIWVMDSKGDTDLVEKIFQVAPDLPPVVSIQMQNSFIREKGRDVAKIEMADATITDGDQLDRSWTIEGASIEDAPIEDAPIEDAPGFQDFSFDSRQHVQFEKTGVGEIQIKLQVKEKWIEPTLPEYVSEEDLKKGELVATAEVINIGPTVWIKPVEGKEAKVYIAARPEEMPLFENQMNWMKASFLEKGVTPQVSLIKRAPVDDAGYRLIYDKTWKSAMWCASTCREMGPIYDENYVYTIQSNSIVAQNYSQVCNGSHTIYAESVDHTLPNWNYTVNQSASFYIQLDNKGEYVYVIFRDGGSTIILNRDTGAQVAVIPITFDGEIFLNQKNEIFLANERQIGKYNPKTGKVEKVSIGGRLIQLMEGKITFVGKDPAGKQGNKFYLGQFDMDQEVLSGKGLPEIPIETISWTGGGKSDILPVALDLNGQVIFIQTYSNSSYGTQQNGTVWMADSKTQEVKCMPMIAPIRSIAYGLKGFSAGFVKDSTGEGRYLYVSYYEDENRYSTTVRWFFKLFDMKMNTNLPIEQVFSMEKQTNATHFAGISYAKIHEAENKIYLLRGNAFQGNDWGGLQIGERMTISLPTSGAESFLRGEAVAQWDVADEYATDNGFLSATYSFYDRWIDPENRVKIFKNTLSDAQAIEASVKKNVGDRGGEDTLVLTDLIPEQGGIEMEVKAICQQVEEKARIKSGLVLKNGEGITREMEMTAGAKYEFEVEVFTSSGAISRVFYPYEYSGDKMNLPGWTHYKELAAVLDFTNPESMASNSFYTFSTSGYLEGRGGLGSGYYGKKNQSRSYNVIIDQTMEKEGYTEFDLFNYFGNQGTGGWSISVDGNLYEVGTNLIEVHKTIFLAAGHHQILVSGWLDGGYYGYIGISAIQTIYYNPETVAGTGGFKEKFSGGSFWNRGSGSFQAPLEPLFNRSSEMKENIRRENFPGNGVSLGEYLRFTGNATCPWSYNGSQGAATMGSGYQNSAVGKFGVVAPLDKHLIVSYKEAIYMERVATSTTLTGGSKMMGSNTFFVAAGQSFYRNYVLQKGRDGGYGHVRVEAIKIIEIPINFSGEAIFGENGAATLNIATRTTPFYLVNLISPESNVYLWHTFAPLYTGSPAEKEGVSLVPQGMTEGAICMIKNLKLYERIGTNKVLILAQNFQKLEDVLAEKWAPLPSDGLLRISSLESSDEVIPPMVYKKGQLVAYDITYEDYENDPSKRQYWQYAHMPMNDGPHPGATQIRPDGTVGLAGPIFGAPIDRFYLDGKYTVTHWQEDNTSRKSLPLGEYGYPAGNAKYDKLSNVEEGTFYIEGTAEAPWVKRIETGDIQEGLLDEQHRFIPSPVMEGNEFKLQIKVDDLEKEVLTLLTEVYKEGKCIFTHYKEKIGAIEGEYPPVITGSIGVATPGEYQVVCTVRDEMGAGLGNYRFTVRMEGKISGRVHHTDAWELNRKKYNVDHNMTGNSEMPRGENTFWPGETFCLKAAVTGVPCLVLAEIVGMVREDGNPLYRRVMTTNGRKNSKGELLYEGEIWDDKMIKNWSGKGPFALTFKFSGIYGKGWLDMNGVLQLGKDSLIKSHEVSIIVEDRDPYFLLHRVW